MIPTLLILSVFKYWVIQLPPGSYIENKIEELRMQGDDGALEQVEAKRDFYHLDEPHVQRYLRWIGVYWFFGKTTEVTLTDERCRCRS